MRKSAMGAGIAASGAVCSVFFAEPSWAADRGLLDALQGNGAITQAQYDSPLDNDESSAEEVVEAVTPVDSGGLNIDDPQYDDESRYSSKIGARLPAETSTHDGRLPTGIEAPDGTELHRARIETKGTIDDDWNWAAEVDFADYDQRQGLLAGVYHRGGREGVMTSGLNWDPNTNIRFMLEWSRILSTDSSTELREVAEGLNITQVRTQYTF